MAQEWQESPGDSTAALYPYDENQDETQPGENEAVEAVAVKPKKKRGPQLTPEQIVPHLSSLQDFRVTSTKGKEKGDLEMLLKKYKNWAHKVQPGLDFYPFINKVEKTLGQTTLLRNSLEYIHDGRDPTELLPKAEPQEPLPEDVTNGGHEDEGDNGFFGQSNQISTKSFKPSPSDPPLRSPSSSSSTVSGHSNSTSKTLTSTSMSFTNSKPLTASQLEEIEKRRRIAQQKKLAFQARNSSPSLPNAGEKRTQDGNGKFASAVQEPTSKRARVGEK